MATQGKVSGSLAVTSRSDILHPRGGEHDQKLSTISLSGTWAGTVDFERSYDAGATWHIVKSYTAIIEENFVVASDYFIYSLNFTRTSGTVDYCLAH